METNTVAASSLVGETLRSLGIQDLFFMMGIGGPDSPPVRSCIEAGIRSFYVRHEQAAAMMAHAYARLSGGVGVCITPLGPGTTNAITGVANAHFDASPLLLIGAGPARGDWGREEYQEQDQMAMLRPVTKAQYRVELPERLPALLGLAVQQATSGRKGAVYVELPREVMHARVDPAQAPLPAPVATPPRPAAEPAALDAALSLLAHARRPLVLAGSGALWANAAAELGAFADATGIPVITTPQARGVLPEDHAMVITAGRSKAQKQADVVLVLGTRANWINGWLRPPRFAADSQLIVVNIDPNEIGRERSPAVGIVGDVRAVLDQLTRSAKAEELRGPSDWLQGLKEEANSGQQGFPGGGRPMHPLEMCAELKAWLPPNAVFVVDGHETLEFVRRSVPALSPGNYLTAGPNACMGVGVPMAIGAKVAAPERPVVLLMGDGAFGWNGLEYETAVRHNLPFVGIVMNNAGFTARPAARGIGRELGFVRYDEVVRGLGGYGELVEDPSDIRPALERAALSNQPALVNICVDPEAQAAGGLMDTLTALSQARQAGAGP